MARIQKELGDSLVKVKKHRRTFNYDYGEI